MNVLGNMLSWIVVKDIEQAIQFYTDVVGFTLMVRSSEHGWAELSGPQGCRLGIAQENDKMGTKAGVNAIVTITVKSLDVARAFFEQKGARLVGEVMEVPGHVRMQTFLDADGNMMQLVEKLDL